MVPWDSGLGSAIEAVKALASDDEEVRQGAVQVLGGAGEHGATVATQVAELLRDERRAVRRSAASALLALGEHGRGPSVMHEIMALLEHEDRNMRVTALSLLGEMKSSEKWTEAVRSESAAGNHRIHRMRLRKSPPQTPPLRANRGRYRAWRRLPTPFCSSDPPDHFSLSFLRQDTRGEGRRSRSSARPQDQRARCGSLARTCQLMCDCPPMPYCKHCTVGTSWYYRRYTQYS